MKAVLKIEEALYREVLSHLLPPLIQNEQAAFLLGRERRTDRALFDVEKIIKLGADDFVVQDDDYLEMKDETRANLIKQAHDTGTSLIEMHSHLGSWPAKFSSADRVGLRETVRHMWWRLNKRPYLAIVVASSGFDALVWLENPKTPQPLDSLVFGSHLLKPTNLSVEGWT